MAMIIKPTGRRLLAIVMMLTMVFSIPSPPAWADDGAFVDPAFQRVWQSADGPVAAGQVNRTWMWGPSPIGAAMEYYRESPGMRRLVQYFDKSRMEITHPEGDSSSQWYVTNGLLAKEMVSGKIQRGDDTFLGPFPQAPISVAGDPDDIEGPTYASFTKVATLNGNENQASDRTGQEVTDFIKRDGTVSQISPPVRVTIANYDTNLHHNIPDVFWNWMNSPAIGVDWVFAMGYPITEPYWANAKIANKIQTVLIQVFERRVLTYNPANPEGWQVEMGNIGRHYLVWRGSPGNYGPVWSPDGSKILFTSTRNVRREIYVMNRDGSEVKNLSNSLFDSDDPAWSPDGSKIAYVRQGQIFIMNADGSDQRSIVGISGPPSWSPDGNKLVYADNTGIAVLNLDGSGTFYLTRRQNGSYDSSPRISPDGKHVAFVRWLRDPDQQDIYIIGIDGTGLVKVSDTKAKYIRGVRWFPDGTKVVFGSMLIEGNRVTSQQVVVANVDGSGFRVLAEGSAPSVSPDGTRIAYSDKGSIWVMNADGTGKMKILPAGGDDPAWSPDGNKIAFTRFVLTSYPYVRREVYVMNADGSGLTQLTQTPGW